VTGPDVIACRYLGGAGPDRIVARPGGPCRRLPPGMPKALTLATRARSPRTCLDSGARSERPRAVTWGRMVLDGRASYFWPTVR